MSEPLVQVVDENDRPLRTAGKPEIWQKGLRHRIVWVVIENSNGEILLQKRPNTMDLYPNCWDVSVGGHIDVDEDYKQAAIREMTEELGLKIKGAKLEELGKFYDESNFKDRKLNRFYKTYRLVTSQKEFDYDKHEITEVKWMDVDRIRELIANQPDKVANGLREVINRYYKS